uniref:Sodefrin-like factor n=1 Tax=Plectus sambesii TaxID=2011161 RepID=A0A914W7H4_9BILA
MAAACIAQLSNHRVLCYSCFDKYEVCDGNGTCELFPSTACSFQEYCWGDSCGFTIYEDNSWSSYCLEYVENQSVSTGCFEEDGRIYCDCLSNFCNHPNNVTEHGWLRIPSNTSYQLNVTLSLPPDDDISCYECGTFLDNGHSVSLPCDGTRFCSGTHCITRNHTSDNTNIAYCGTSWDTKPNLPNNPGCSMDNSTQDKICVCNTAMCNDQFADIFVPPSRQLVCYDCFNLILECDEKDGQLCDRKPCSFNNTCIGDTCALAVYEDATWESYCLTYDDIDQVQPSGCLMTEEGTVLCECIEDSCNDPAHLASQKWREIPNDPSRLNAALALPEIPQGTPVVKCYQCGAFELYDGTLVEISCDQQHVCDGIYCGVRQLSMEEAGFSSFCATSWDSPQVTGCMQQSERSDQICSCGSPLCNTRDYSPPALTTSTLLPTTSSMVTSSTAAATSSSSLTSPVVTAEPSTTVSSGTSPSSPATSTATNGNVQSEQIKAVQNMADLYNQYHAGESGLSSQIANSIFDNMINIISNDKNANVMISSSRR